MMLSLFLPLLLHKVVYAYCEQAGYACRIAGMVWQPGCSWEWKCQTTSTVNTASLQLDRMLSAKKASDLAFLSSASLSG